jgi:hypothetical protein
VSNQKHFFHIDKKLIFLASFIYLAKALLFFFQNPNFTWLWDWPGHLQKAKVATLPWQGGWDTTFWGGYPTTIYPNLYHLLLKLVINVTNSEIVGAALLVLAIFGLQLHAVWSFVKSKQGGVLTFLLTLVLMVHGSSNMLGSFRGTLITGGGPAALATALLLYFLASQSWPTSAIFLGLLLLTHPLTASVAILYLVISMVVHFRSKNILKFKFAVLTLTVGSLIGLPWIMPFVDNSFATAAMNLGGSSTVLPWIILTVVVLTSLEAKTLLEPLVMTVITLGLISTLPEREAVELQHIGIKGVHFYRYLWYVLVLSPAVIANSIYRIVWSKQVRNLLKPRHSTVIVSRVVILLAIILAYQPVNRVSFEADLSSVKHLTGRVMDASKYTTNLDFPYTMEHLLARDTSLVGTTGLFYESTSRGLQYYDLKNTIDPKSRKNGTYHAYFINVFGESKKILDIKDTADLLGINYIAFTSRDLPPPDKPNIYHTGTFHTEDTDGTQLEVYYLVEQVVDTKIVETLDKLPTHNPTINLGTWWLDTDHDELISDTKYDVPEDEDVDLTKPSVTDLTINPTTIEFKVNSDQPSPVMIKFTYSPYWKAEVTGQGSTTQPIWVTPGHMLVLANGNVKLTWKTPSYLKMFAPISAIALGSVVTAEAWHRFKRRET